MISLQYEPPSVPNLIIDPVKTSFRFPVKSRSFWMDQNWISGKGHAERKISILPAVEKIIIKQTNCLSCNKPLRKITRYYRDGKYYCNKKCWRTFKNKSKEEAKT